jgi:hypothetical protein
VHVEDLGGGNALLRINLQVSWPVALEVLRLVKGPDAVEVAEADEPESGDFQDDEGA